MTSRMARCSRHAALMVSSFFSAIPGTSVSLAISPSKISSVSLSKCLTIFLAVLGPTPLMSPDPRYFSNAALVAGLMLYGAVALNCRPYLGLTVQAPINSMVAPAKTRVW
jgi:hypothetical protein